MESTATLQLAGCPRCAAPAEVTDRFVLDSSDGLLEHVTVLCARRHRFTMLAEGLPVPVTPTGDGSMDLVADLELS